MDRHNKDTKMKKIIIFHIILMCICISCNVTKYQYSPFNINSFEVIEKDSSVLKNYMWTKCVINEKDTVIFLLDKTNRFYEIQYPIIKIEKIYSINDDIGYRLYKNDIFIDERLYFPKEMVVYYINYSKCGK